MPSVSSVIHTTYMHYLVHARVLKLINLDTVTKIISWGGGGDIGIYTCILLKPYYIEYYNNWIGSLSDINL